MMSLRQFENIIVL